MADEFRVDIGGIQGLLKKLGSAKRPDVINRSLFSGAVLIAGWSKQNRLTGPRPRFLGVVTGRLRSSISASQTEQNGNTFISRIGTNVKYASVHERGFKGRVSIRSFVRHTKSGSHLVKSHLRNMNVPKREFLRPAILNKGNQEQVLKILTENINEAMQKS